MFSLSFLVSLFLPLWFVVDVVISFFFVVGYGRCRANASKLRCPARGKQRMESHPISSRRSRRCLRGMHAWCITHTVGGRDELVTPSQCFGSCCRVRAPHAMDCTRWAEPVTPQTRPHFPALCGRGGVSHPDCVSLFRSVRRFSHQMEREADFIGLQLMSKACFDPHEMPEVNHSRVLYGLMCSLSIVLFFSAMHTSASGATLLGESGSLFHLR